MSLNLTLFEPNSAWVPPVAFPNLSSVKRISVDLETKDPLLKEKGPGTFRRDGYPVGIALATNDYAQYFPFAHLSGGNMNRDSVLSFFKDLLKRPDLEVIFANAQYDMEWLWSLGINVAGIKRDIQIAEGMLDEEQDSYSLDSISKRRLGITKDETLLKEAAAAYGINAKAELWKLHSKYVGPYGIGDVRNTYDIFEKQEKILKEQNLWKPFDTVECRLPDILLQMRINGVRVDLDKAEVLSEKYEKEEEKFKLELKKECGYFLDVWSGDALARECDNREIKYPTTEKGNPSFDKIFLKHCDIPFLKLVQKIRSINRLRETYIDKLIFGCHINGRIHAQFHQGKRDEAGTVTGRFSSSNPNLQQVPSRDKELAPLIRSLFLPEEGEKWGKLDYSQQEPRLLTHFAFKCHLTGADVVRDEYLRDKTTDFYTLVAKVSGLERKPAKDLTLGICYGEGIDKIANDIGVSVDKAREIKKVFDLANPFIKEISEMAMRIAEDRGYIKTINGRHRHFNFFEPADVWQMKRYGQFVKPLRLEEAMRYWSNKNLKRAWCYKALNALIQGSAADMTKAAMIRVYDDLKKIPLLQVHDELDYSLRDNFEGTSIQFRMENAVDTCVPMLAELEIGDHWK